MSFKAVWGFDPEEVIKAQQASHQAGEERASEDELDGLTVAPYGDDAQIYELRRMFRLYGAELFA